MTHDELVARAARWLRNTKKCGVVFAEVVSGATNEIPDAIGWKYGGLSLLVECKASRADFRTDAKKSFRIDPESGMGQRRYYMTPPALLSREDLPAGWGLIEVRGKVSKVVVEAMQAPLSDSRAAAELPLLLSVLWKYQHGVMKPRKLADEAPPWPEEKQLELIAPEEA